MRVAVFPLLAAALLCLALPALATEEGRIKINIGRLREEIALQEDMIQQSGEEETAVLDELDSLNSKIEAQKQGKVLVLHKQLQAQRQELAQKQSELDKTKAACDKAKQHMLNRMRSFYMMGSLGLLNVTFSNRDLPELLLTADAFQQLVAYDRAVVERYQASVREQERAALALELEESLLEELARQAEEEQQVLEGLRAEREELLTRIKTQQNLCRLAINGMRRAEDDLQQSLIRLQKKKREAGLDAKGFLKAKGSLPMPAEGKLLHTFGEVLKNGLRKGEKVNGIHIKVASDTPAQAVFGGRVVFAGYRNGYGNAVIIEHGGGWFTVTSRLDTVLVREGEVVKQRQQIGLSGDLATLYEPGLYFELRQGTAPQDPMQWFKAE
jgi:septal ring factor EnvC (AmiA/AmiB activator)